MQKIPVILYGIGGVGRALLKQILKHRELHAKQYGITLQLAAICDSSGAISDPASGLSDETVSAALAWKEAGKRLADHVDGRALDAGIESVVDAAIGVANGTPVVVDCTATDATLSALLHARQSGCKIVLANKIPLTSSQGAYDRLTRAGSTTSASSGEKEGEQDAIHSDPINLAPINLAQSRWETTVGAGLPVIATLNRLVASGDEVTHMAGTFSGTLGYVMTGLQEGKLLSEIVREAYDLGYTEPDPRDDLGGVDVARKALILARGLGWQLNMADVDVEGLYPPSMDSLSVDEFLDSLPDLDIDFAARVQQAADEGNVLRFAATVTDGTCVVKPTVVSAESPLGRLGGTDNLIEFTTAWYNPNPLVIQGRGAGVDATAAGVLSDIIELAYTKND